MTITPCNDWDITFDCCDFGNFVPTPEQLEKARLYAQDVMFTLTAYQFNNRCTTVLQPCKKRCRCECRDQCRCRWDKLDLYNIVNHELQQLEIISIDIYDDLGIHTVVPTTDYKFDNGRFLTPRLGGLLDPYPVQTLNEAVGEPNTWGITVEYGLEPPLIVLVAAEEIACDYLKRCLDPDCKPPLNTTSMNRNGVKVDLRTGYYGFTSVQLALKKYGKKASRAALIDPLQVQVVPINNN